MRPARARRGAVAVVVLVTVGLPFVTRLAVAGPAGPPPTPVPPNGSPSPFPQSLQTPQDATARPDLDVPVAYLADLDDGQAMFAKAPLARRPIASLTKIMTALLTLERTSLDDVVTITPEAVFGRDDFGASSSLGLRAGEKLTVRDLLYALMLQSSNDAAVALAIEVAGSEAAFVRLMNRRAATLGMDGTVFFSPNGLDDRGRSTALDLTRLVRVAYDTPGFAPIVATKFRTIPAPPGGKPRKIQNRNALLWLYPDAMGVKTGSTAGAGYCVVAVAERGGRRLISVVLGSGNEPFSEAATLFDYGFEAFEERTFVTAGQDLGTVAIRGGVVPVEAGAALEGLVPAEAGQAKRRIVVSPEAVFPPAADERIGTLKVTIPGVTVGAVPVVVSDVPAPPAAGDGPWWARASGAVVEGIGDVLRGIFG